MQFCEIILENLKKYSEIVVSTRVSKKIRVKLSDNKSVCRQNKELTLSRSRKVSRQNIKNSKKLHKSVKYLCKNTKKVTEVHLSTNFDNIHVKID